MKTYAFFLILVLTSLIIPGCQFPEPMELAPCDPVVAFSFSEDNISVGEQVDFNNLSDQASSYLWEFGDGTTSGEENPSHTYVEPGLYKVILKAICGQVEVTLMKELNVQSTGPVACFTFAINNGDKFKVAFNADCTKEAGTFAWDFGDESQSKEKNPEHSYSRSGVYQVKLTVVNAGKTSVAEQEVLIQGVKTFEAWYGSTGGVEEGGEDVLEIPGEGFIVVGHRLPANSSDYDGYMLKVDESGNIIWENTYGYGNSSESFKAIDRLPDGKLVAVGSSYISTAKVYDIFLCVMNEDGSEIFKKKIGDSNRQSGFDVKVWNNSLLILGTTGELDVSNIYLLRTDFNGNVMSGYPQSYGGSKSDTGSEIMLSLDGGFAIVGQTKSIGVGGDIYLLKFKNNGTLRWEKNYGTTNEDKGLSIAETEQGEIVIAGSTWVNNVPDKYVVKIDADGNKIWANAYPGANYDYINSVAIASDGGIVVTGSLQTISNDLVVFIKKISPAGNEIWEKLFSKYYGNCIRRTTDNGFIVTGWYNNKVDNQEDVYLIKTDSDGNVF